jgi:hypothetical protein
MPAAGDKKSMKSLCNRRSPILGSGLADVAYDCSGRFRGTWASGIDRMGLAKAAGGRDPPTMKGRAMTTAIEFVRASHTDQGSLAPFWDRQEEERRRRGPALTAAQWEELSALGHQLLNPLSN